MRINVGSNEEQRNNMGLDTSHDCWHGAYSAFGRWRAKVCEVAGHGKLDDRAGFGGAIPWPTDDPLVKLLYHSDCDGEIAWEDCAAIADRLEELLPALKRAGDGGGHIGDYAESAGRFIAGLRLAASRKENVDFH